MIPDPCKLERFFARWEFSVDHVLCASDVQGYPLAELLALADRSTLAMWERLDLGYTETAGHPELRAAIAEQYELTVPNDILVCGGGAAEALYLTAQVLLGPGTHAVVVWPAFESLYRVAAATGAQVSLVPLAADNGWSLDLAAIERALRPETRAIFVNFPHNPTGTQLEPGAFQALIALAASRRVTLVSDEVYRYLEFDPTDRLPAAADLDPTALSVGVMSKAYGLAGLRIGWIATRDADVLTALRTIKDYTSVCASAPSEILALMALRARDTVVGRCRQIVLENLRRVTAFFDAWPSLFDWTPPRAGTVGFPLLQAELPVARFVTDLAEQESVLLLPGSVFDSDDNRFRIGLGRTSTPQALERLDRFVARTLG